MAYRPSAVRNQVSSSAPVVPNLVPVMNLFLTIVPFLLVMLVVSQVALIVLNFNQSSGPANAPAGTGGRRNTTQVWVVIRAPNSRSGGSPGFEVREPGATQKIELTGDRYDFASLDTALKQVKTNYPTLADINVAPADEVLYDNLIKTIDICRFNGFSVIHYRPLR